jgi:hypothetical protein
MGFSSWENATNGEKPKKSKKARILQIDLILEWVFAGKLAFKS